MTGGIEAAGDALTGAVIGRAVEPRHGEGGGEAHGHCLNCGTELHGSHCHNCGQAAHVHRSLASLWHDIAHGVFHFEGKVWRTLPMLAWRPGELTRRYVHGERARFVSPLALFLFSVFLMFATINSIAGELHAPVDTKLLWTDKTAVEIDREIAKQQARLAPLKVQRDGVRAAGGDTRAIDAKRQAVADEMRQLGAAKIMVGGKDSRGVNINTGWAPLDNALAKAKSNPDLVLYKLQTSAYKYSWALIPLSTPFLWLLFFWRRQFKLYDHAIFITYSLTFMMLLVIVLTIAGAVGVPSGAIATAGTFVPPLHIYRQLRGAYGIGRIGALIRTFALAIFGAVVLTLFVVLLLALGLMG